MTLWILWSMGTSLLVAAAATALDRAAFYVGLSRRLVWIGAIVITMVAPLLLGSRRPPAALTLAPAVTPAPVVALFAAPRAGSGRSTISIEPSTAPAALESVSPESPGSFHRSMRAELRDTFATWSITAARADRWVIRAWIVASCVLLALFGAAILRLGVARSRWKTVETEIGRVLLAPDVGPAVVGFFRPRIVLPSWAMYLEAKARELLLRHELEHLRAGDTRTLLAAEFSLAIFPWNAALWWMVRRLRLAIEMDCDARVIRSVGSVYEYASMLLGVGERYSAGLPLAASLAEPRSSLEARIDAMTAVRRRRPIAACLPLLVLAALTLVTAAWTPRPDPLLPSRARAALLEVRDSRNANASAHRAPLLTEAIGPFGRNASSPRETRALPKMDSASADPKPVPPFAPPVYPEQLRHDLVDGHVLLRLNADARGIPDMASIQVIESTNDLFTVAVRNAIRTWRFDSAGEVRLAFRFITTGTNSSEAASGGKLTYSVDGKPVQPVVITTLGQRPEYFIDGRSCAPTGCFPPAGTEGQYRGPESSRDSGVASNMRVSRDTSPSDSLLAVVGYLQRKQAGRGFFVDGQMIDRQASSLSQMLRIVPGFKISPTGDGHTYAVQDASDRTDGCVNFYVDGALWQQSTPGDMDDHLSAAQVLAIEAYHRSESPWQFWPTGRPTCATIVIWTRSRVGGSRALGPPDNDTLYAHVVTGQTISTTVAQAEAEGASFPREDAPAVNQPFFAHAFAGIADRRCVVGQEGEDPHASGSLRSGEMIIRGRWNDPQGLKAGEDIEYDNLRHDVPSRDLQQIPTRTIENKLLWAPLHGGALQGTPLVLRAARIGAPADTFRLSVAGLAHTPGPPPGREYGYPSLVTFPTPGQWLVVATAGSDWGCFVLNVAKPH